MIFIYKALISILIYSCQLRRDFEKEKQEAICKALASASAKDSSSTAGSDAAAAENPAALELEKLIGRHKQEISATKKKQWVSGGA